MAKPKPLRAKQRLSLYIDAKIAEHYRTEAELLRVPFSELFEKDILKVFAQKKKEMGAGANPEETKTQKKLSHLNNKSKRQLEEILKLRGEIRIMHGSLVRALNVLECVFRATSGHQYGDDRTPETRAMLDQIEQNALSLMDRFNQKWPLETLASDEPPIEPPDIFDEFDIPAEESV